MNEDPEAHIVARVAAGDEAVFQSIYEEEAAYVHDLALRMTGNGADAQDVTQEVFVAAWRALPSFRGESRFRTWLHRITLRVVWADIRRRDRCLWLELDDAGEVGTQPIALEARMDLERALASLPAGARTIVLLHEIDGFRYREIADLLDISIGTVKSQLHRARNLLIEHLS